MRRRENFLLPLLLFAILLIVFISILAIQPTSVSATNLPSGVTTTNSDIPLEAPPEPFESARPLGGGARTDESEDLIRLNDFRNDSRYSNIDGSGYAVVILDTGIDRDHPFFGPDRDNNGIADRIVFSYDFADKDTDASDGDVNGHGSNVSSIAAGNGAGYQGVATGADIIHLKVFPDSGSGNFGFVEEALQWVISNKDTYNIVSVNMSLGDSKNHNTFVEPENIGIDDEIRALKIRNIVVIASTGNSFHDFSSALGVGYPAADPNTLGVGAVYDSTVGGFSYFGAIAHSTGPDRIAPFTQRHPNLLNVMAPGAPIDGASSNGGIVTMHGTSQAAPHVAGLVALMQQLAVRELGRQLTVDEFENYMISTSNVVNDGDNEDDNVINTGLNFPRINVLKMAERISIDAVDFEYDTFFPILPKK